MRKIREPDIGCRVSLRLSWCVAIPQHVTERTPEIPAPKRVPLRRVFGARRDERAPFHAILPIERQLAPFQLAGTPNYGR
jgi:hypothetical protein